MDGLATAKHKVQRLAVGLLVPLLVAIALAACEPGPIAIPPGAQEVHAIVSGDTVRLEPASARAGTIYLVIDEPRTTVFFVEAQDTADESSAGPLSDDDLERLGHGDTFHTSMNAFDNDGPNGNVMKLVLAAGKYAFLSDNPDTLAERSGGVIPSQSLAVLEVLP